MKTISRFVTCGEFLFVVCFLVATITPLHSQWIHTDGVQDGSVHAFAATPAGGGSGTNLFAGMNLGGVILSTNNGSTWTHAGLTNTTVLSFAVAPGGGSVTNLFAGTTAGVFLSTNNGISWTQTGLTNFEVYALAAPSNGAGGTSLFAGTHLGGALLSSDNGASWTPVNSGSTSAFVYSLAVSGTNLFAGTETGVLRSTDNGSSWTAASTGLTSTIVLSLVVSGTNLFAGTLGGVFLSTNNGTSWTPANVGLTSSFVYAFAIVGTNLLAGTNGGVFLSSNNGTTWTAVNTGLPIIVVSALAVSSASGGSGTNLLAGTNGNGVWRRPLSEIITSVEWLPTDLPRHFILDQNYPNPFNPTTAISYRLPAPSDAEGSVVSVVTLGVYDVLGREISRIVDGVQQAGTHTVRWDASAFPSGVYFYRLRSGEYIETKKMIVLK